MKPINFIKAVSPQEQHALYRWYRISTLLCILFFGSIFMIQGVQLWHLYTTHAQVQAIQPEYMKLQELLHQRAALRTTHTTLQEKAHTLTTMTTQLRKPTLHLKAIKECLASRAILENCTLEKGSVTITLRCSSVRSAHTITNALGNTSYFSALRLVSLSYDAASKNYRACIIGTHA